VHCSVDCGDGRLNVVDNARRPRSAVRYREEQLELHLHVYFYVMFYCSAIKVQVM
jgi:hypothetical protein